MAALRSSQGVSNALVSALPLAGWELVLSVPLYLEYQDVLLRPGLIPPAYARPDIELFCRFLASIAHAPYPYHSHSAQCEFYHVLSGTGLVRHQDGTTPIAAGDAFLFRPGQPHQLINDSAADLVVSVVADNPLGESCHYPDSGKWLVRSPERRLLRSDGLDYFDGEE